MDESRTKKEIFISCCSNDIDQARYVKSFLESNNHSCFLYADDILAGEKHEEIVPIALKNCELVVLIESPEAIASEWVQNELTLAHENKKPLIELQISACTPEQLDNIIYRFGNTNRITVYNNQFAVVLPLFLKSVEVKLPKPTAQESTKSKDSAEPVTEKVFDYDAETGSMFNPDDGMRNVSFRQDTFLTMMRTIYDKIGRENAYDVFFECGKTCGRNFGKLLNDTWKKSRISFSEKLDKWCEFDSQVGWGKFVSNIELDEENGTLTGNLTIKDCFFVDDENQYEVCSYIKGYCTGVIEQLIRNQVKLTCTGKGCPMKNSFKSECVFNIAFEREE